MPGIKPADFLRDVRRRFAHTVVVVITGYGSIEGAVEATKMGAFDYLTKPIVDDEIRVVVEKAVRQQSLLFENQTLKQQLDLRFGLENIVGHDYKMLKIFDLVEAVADSRTTVLMTGESGHGQVAAGARDPSPLAAAGQAVCRSVVRIAAGDAAGIGAVRPCERRVHRRDRGQDGPVHGRGRRDDFSR